jgi:hypothetical protein
MAHDDAMGQPAGTAPLFESSELLYASVMHRTSINRFDPVLTYGASDAAELPIQYLHEA